MKLTAFTGSKQKEASAKDVDITIRVRASSEKEAAEMQQAIQGFISHFTLAEMKSAALKLRNPVNRRMIKTFL